MKHVAGPPELAHAALRRVVGAGDPVLHVLEVAAQSPTFGVRRRRVTQQRVLFRGGERDPRLAVLRDRGHVERAERAEKRALILGRFDGEQLIEERRDFRGGRSRHDRFGERLERLRLMGVEEHRRVGRAPPAAAPARSRGIDRCSCIGCCASAAGQRESGAAPPRSVCSATRRGMPSVTGLSGIRFDGSGW